MFDLELNTLRAMANNNAVEEPLRLVLAEILVAKQKVTEMLEVTMSGSATCRYNTITHEPISYTIRVQQGDLGNIVHELTHVAVNEAYDQDFVNYPSPYAQNVPARVYMDFGYPDGQNQEARQGRFMDNRQNQLRTRVLDDLIAKANAARAQLGNDRCDRLVKKFQFYAKASPHTEFDTVINQTFVWLHEWRNEPMNRAGTPLRSDPVFTTLFVSLSNQVADAYHRREQARTAVPARPMSTVLHLSSPPETGAPAATKVIPEPRGPRPGS